MDRKDRVKVNIYKELLKEEKGKNHIYKKGVLSVFLFLIVTIGYFDNNLNLNNEKKNITYMANLYQKNITLDDIVNINIGTNQDIYSEVLSL